VDLARAFTYPFDDPKWAEKLVIAAILAFLSLIPLLGLLAVAALLGWSILLIRNVRDGHAFPLPGWDDLGDYLANGGSVMAAFIAYNIPNVLIGCCLAVIPASLGGSDFFAIIYGTSALCCIIPLLIVYNIAIWPMLALGSVRFADTGQIGAYFQFNDLLTTLWENGGATIQWLLYSLVISLVLGALNAVPCLGSIAAIALTVPAQAHLIGQFGALVEDKPKRKYKRA
jgi:hypothetical protein